jgi:molybdopterin synthase sulfur carrier subunit
MMTIQVLAFGIVKEIFGQSVVKISVAGNNVAALKIVLEEKYPRLKQLASYMVAVNNQYAQPDRLINHTDEIAIIPPVSGG